MKINVKEDLKELVNFESNKDDIKMVNAAGDVKEDKYDGPTYLAIFTWIYALCTSRYKTPRLFGEIFKYTLYVWVVGLVLMSETWKLRDRLIPWYHKAHFNYFKHLACC